MYSGKRCGESPFDVLIERFEIPTAASLGSQISSVPFTEYVRTGSILFEPWPSDAMRRTSPGTYGNVMWARCFVPSASVYPSNPVSPLSTNFPLTRNPLPVGLYG